MLLAFGSGCIAGIFRAGRMSLSRNTGSRFSSTAAFGTSMPDVDSPLAQKHAAIIGSQSSQRMSRGMLVTQQRLKSWVGELR